MSANLHCLLGELIRQLTISDALPLTWCDYTTHTPCLVIVNMADMEAVRNCIITGKNLICLFSLESGIDVPQTNFFVKNVYHDILIANPAY